MPKLVGETGRDIPDFVLGRFNPGAHVERWVAVGEIKDSSTDLDQPQLNRSNKETPVEQGFRYATRGKAGIEWVIVSNFKEIRLYKNGYVGAFHQWKLVDLKNENRLYEFYAVLRPTALIELGRTPLTSKLFQESVSAGEIITESFYGLYKLVQQALLKTLSDQPASQTLTVAELYGKTHKLLNRILFAKFCEDHSAELLSRGTVKNVREWSDGEGGYWRSYREFFRLLNHGGGKDGVAFNAFNGGLFAHDQYYSQVSIPNELFDRRFQFRQGKRKSLEIAGIFGFDVYDFGDDLNAQALGAIFEQSLKDIPKSTKLVRGFGELDVSSQKAGGVYYTPPEITSYMVKQALHAAVEQMEREGRDAIQAMDVSARRIGPRGRATSAQIKKDILFYEGMVDKLSEFRIVDPACGSGAFLVDALHQLQLLHQKTNSTVAELRGHHHKQLSAFELNRLILRSSLHGRDVLPESIEISRLSLWLNTATKGEKLETLEGTIFSADTLRDRTLASYDVVIGNPPWGADLDGWTDDEILRRFPDCGEEKDSFAAFIIRSWEVLKPAGILAFILPNSWLTVAGYAGFRAWLLRHFIILELTNVWKIFADVNHDACILIARKRLSAADLDKDHLEADREMRIRAVQRGCSEADKLKQLAEEQWYINGDTTHGFQWRQDKHRFETIYPPEVAAALDVISANCNPLGKVADITVGIQVYHNTRVSREFIKKKGFHSRVKMGGDWYPYIESNDVQRYFRRDSMDQWLQYSETLHDKRELEHYREPRILVQQIFWKRLSSCLEVPSEPCLYLNTLFAIYNAKDIPLEYILGILNSKFVSATYERRSNRLFGDKFPKVSKVDLALVPIPNAQKHQADKIGKLAIVLQEQWVQFRAALIHASGYLATVQAEASLAQFGNFWKMRESEFVGAVSERHGALQSSQVVAVKNCHRDAMIAVNSYWHKILSGEKDMEMLVKGAFRASDQIYENLTRETPDPDIGWALLALP